MICMLWESIRFGWVLTRTVDQFKVEAWEVEGPASLVTIWILGREEISEVLMVIENLTLVLSSFQNGMPFFQSPYDRKQFLIMDGIVAFSIWEAFKDKAYWPPFLVTTELGYISPAEFAYNNCVHSSTQTTPFMLDTGQHPRLGVEPVRETQLEALDEFTEHMEAAIKEAHSAYLR